CIRACACCSAATGIYAEYFGQAFNCPSSKYGSTGPQSSASARAAANGSLPQPLRRRSIPCRYTNLPVSSTAYHQRMNRNCSFVGTNGRPARGPDGWVTYSNIKFTTWSPIVRSGSGNHQPPPRLRRQVGPVTCAGAGSRSSCSTTPPQFLQVPPQITHGLPQLLQVTGTP